MFETLAELMMELFAQSPASFMAMADRMVAFIDANHIVPFVFVVAVTLLVINVILEPDSFGFISSLIKLTAVFIVITFLMARWSTMVPVIGESLSYELANIVIGPDGTGDDEPVCGKSRAERKDGLKDLYKDDEVRDAMADSTSVMQSVCGKVDKAFTMLTTPIMTADDVIDSGNFNMDEINKQNTTKP